MIKLIAIDLDGTLLNKDKRISQENKVALKMAMEKGVKVVVCSGRIFSGARVFAMDVGANGPMIACNGAIIKDLQTEEVIYSSTMVHEDCIQLIDLCHQENVYFHVYVGETMFTEKLGFSSLFYWQRNQELPEEDRIDIRVVKDLKEELQTGSIPAFKFVLVSDDPEQLQRIRALIGEIKGVQVTSSFRDNLEIINAGVGKGHALKLLAERLGIKQEEVMAIGDNENDESMLQYAGLSVAMENAEDYIKDMADFITLSNEEHGVAYAVKKFVLE